MPTTQGPSNVGVIADWSRLLTGRIAVVTGGGDGIGGAISRLFASHGAHIQIAEVDPARAERTVSQIREHGGEATAYVVDVTTEAGVTRLATGVLEAHRQIDVLVNNVGDFRPPQLVILRGQPFPRITALRPA